MTEKIRPEDTLANSNNQENGMSRRQALKLLGIGSGALIAGGTGGFLGYRRSLRVSSSEAAIIRNARIVIAGGSIGGLTVAARLIRAVPDANITVIEPRTEHHYQPGYTLVAAGVYEPKDVVYKQEDLFLPGVRWVRDYVERFDPQQNRLFTRGGDRIDYDYLVVGLGVETDYGRVENLAEALETPYAAQIYNMQSGIKYKEMARNFEGGRTIFTYPAGYVKCGGAPQKITWLSEDLWRKNGIRDRTEVHFHTPTASLFPVVPVVDRAVTPKIEARGILNHYNQTLRAVDLSTRTAIFEESMADGSTREVRRQYDLLHPTPSFRTPKPLRESDLTREGAGGQLDVNRATLQHNRFPNVFGVGDCAATGAPKTAATIRKQAPAVVGNLIDLILERDLSYEYDGTSGCPLLTRYGRCMMFEFDFNGNLINEWIYQPTTETRLWWNFKVHGLKRLYRHVMMNGFV